MNVSWLARPCGKSLYMDITVWLAGELFYALRLTLFVVLLNYKNNPRHHIIR